MRTKSLLMTFGLVLAQTALADAPLKDLPGAIPSKYERQCASDLFFEGKPQQPDDMCKRFEQAEKKFEASGKKDFSLRFDLSKIDPDPTSSLWRPKKDAGSDILSWKPGAVGEGFYDDMKAMGLQEDGDTVEYVSDTDVPSGRFAVIVQKRSADGTMRAYQIRMDLKGHNLLMRKTLLRKLGYKIPLMDRLKTVKIRFRSSADKFVFTESLFKRTFVEASRWVTAGEKTDDETLTLQDVIVIDGAQDSTFNVARGALASKNIQGRRLFNSLLLPFSMTDAPESINLMSWTQGGTEFNDQLYMPYEFSEAFSTSYEDARWMGRRITALTKRDWQEVVASAKVPKPVASILIEKLISRRNFMRERLNLAKESGHIDAHFETSTLLAVNESMSDGDLLKEGQLIGSKWPGYARDFGGNNPDSPQSREEMFGYFKSQGLSNMIMNLVIEFNKRLPKTDLAWKEFDRDLTLSAWQFAEFLKTKQITPIPRNLWSTRFYDIHAFARRDTIAGNYLGTENQIQIADSIDMSMEAGWSLRGEGLPAKMALSGKAKIAYMKSYSHVKPMVSMKAGLSEDFRNIMVPYLKSQATLPLHNIIDLESNAKKVWAMPETDKSQKDIKDGFKAEVNNQIKDQMSDFNKLFGKGESVIVTTSMGPDVSFILAKGLSGEASVYAKVRDRFVDMDRLHIFRKDEKTVHVYFDPTLYNEFSFGLGIRAKIPIIAFDWSFRNGATTTHYFELNIDSDLDQNPQFFDNMLMVAAALKGASLKFFQAQRNPWIFTHTFSDKDFDFAALIKRYKTNKSQDKIEVKTPQGATQKYVRQLKGYRSGTDYQSFIVDVTAALLREKYPDLHIQAATSGNPADTIKGKALSRQVSVEAEITPNGIRKENFFAGIRYTWKGWDIKKASAEKILDEVQDMYQSNLFLRPDLNDTKAIQFYNVTVNVSIYREALNYIMSMPDETIRQIFEEHSKDIFQNRSPEMDSFTNSNPWANAVISDRKAIQKYWSKDPYRASEEIADLLYIAESQLTFAGFKKMVGGVQNMFVIGSLDGFRVGDQKGQHSLTSKSLGQIGNQEAQGPLATIQGFNNISGGELFISWLLSNL